MSDRVLLDANIIIPLLAQDTLVQERLAEAVEVFVPSIVLGELYYGAYKSSRVTINLARIDAFATHYDVLACDEVTALVYGRINHLVRRKGRPIPDNDIWIAAIAMQHHLTLVSRDAHFQEVDGLLLEMW